MHRKRIHSFQDIVWDHYNQHARQALPWRMPEEDGTFDAYKILVSEIMLQQTQVQRVIPKYHMFIRQFPTVESLAAAELGDVLRIWQGLGYSRRAKFLWQAAQAIRTQHDGVVPRAQSELVALPGVGTNTAGAILAYAYNIPVVFIETNIRTVYIYHFFADKTGVSDKELEHIVQKTLPDDPSLVRTWYWALMDYGTFIKATVGNLNKLSNTYAKQPTFQGSRRQIRGQVLRTLAGTSATFEYLQQILADERLDSVLQDLQEEGLITLRAGKYHL